ncbi:MAG: TolB family protein [Sphingobacteriaceae bacterium]
MLFLNKKNTNNILKISLFILIISSFSFSTVQAQIFSAEQNPPSIKWEQINTPNFQLIYPTPLKEQGQNIANLLEVLIEKVSRSIGKEPKKISIILQNQGTTANGFVQLAPRRSEFYTTPSQAFDFQNWLNSLAVHELRHVVQFDKLTGKFNSPPLESLTLAIFGITLPSWFFEGDAVTTETVLTNAGRGRIPEWSIELRSNTLSDKSYSYSKNYFGSVRDFTPGYYQLGFFMNTKLRRDFGDAINDSILTRISRNFLRPYNFSNSVKKFTGMSTKKLHDSTIFELKSLWAEQLKKVKFEEYNAINKRRNQTPENFLLPAATPSGSILFLKESKAETPAIYELLNTGKMHKVLNIGSQEIPWFSYAAEKIVWDEFRFDARYQQRSFNVINIYDMKKKTKKQLTHKSRLFAPSLSPDGTTIVAVEVSTNHEVSLVELNAKTGKETKRFAAPENYMLQMPSFNQTGDKIVVVAVAINGKTLYELDRSTSKFTQLIPLQSQEILHPVYASDQIIFKAHFNGIDNLYKLNPADKQIYQLTSSKFGAHNPSFNPKTGKILFNNYSVEGYNISSIDFKGTDGENITSIEKAIVNYADPLIAEDGVKNIFENIPKKNYETTPYREISNLFYFHSILPVVEDNPLSNDGNLGVRLQSDNKLNTLSFYTAYKFNNTLRKSEYEAGFNYSKFFPILNISYLNRPRLLNRRATVAGKPIIIPVSWRENEYKADINVPILANRFNTTYNLNFKVGTSYTTRYNIENNYSGLIETLEFPMYYELALSRNSRRSARDLAPKWGQNVSARFRHFPFENQVDGKLFTFRSTFYFPGIARNHSLQASFNFQDGDGAYNNIIDIPRVSGYSFLKPGPNTRNTLFLDYRLPLFYPDWELDPLAYIKRFKAGFFADFENIDSKNKFRPRSYGAELRSDMNLLRFPLPNFDLGGKIIFLNEKPRQNPIFEFITSYNF